MSDDGRDQLIDHFFSVTDDGDESIVPAPRPTQGHTFIDLSFSVSDDVKTIDIKLEVDAAPGVGGVVWPAAEALIYWGPKVLSRHISRRGLDSLRDQTVVELGAGTGLVGFVAAKLGAPRVIITDQLSILPTMERNIELNSLQSQVNAVELAWGAPLPPSIPPPGDISLILAADCVYYEPAFPLLVQTLKDLCQSHRTEVLFCYKKRRKADKQFFALLKKAGFIWEDVDDPDRPIYSREAIFLFRLKLRQKHP